MLNNMFNTLLQEASRTAHLLIDNAKAVSELERRQLLSSASSSAETCKRIPFILTWHHKFHGIGKILHQNYFEMIKDHPHLKSTFPEPPRTF